MTLLAYRETRWRLFTQHAQREGDFVAAIRLHNHAFTTAANIYRD
jgi:hypothetical protein